MIRNIFKSLVSATFPIALSASLMGQAADTNRKQAGQKNQETYTCTIGGTEIKGGLEFLPDDPVALVNGIFEHDGPVMILISDTGHASIGNQRIQNQITEGCPFTDGFFEAPISAQALYDNFRDSFIADPKADTKAVRTLKNRISQSPYNSDAPNENLYPELRKQFLYEHHRSYEIPAQKNIALNFCDVSADESPETYKMYDLSVKANNRRLIFDCAHSVLWVLFERQKLPIQEAIKDLNIDIQNIGYCTVKETLSLVEEDKLKLINAAKKTLEVEFKKADQYPKDWPSGEIDFNTKLKFDHILGVANVIHDQLELETLKLEEARDEYRDKEIVKNIAAGIKKYKGDIKKFRGFLNMGQGHFNDKHDQDEMIRELFAKFDNPKVVRIDPIPCSKETIARLKSRVARANYQGSDYVIFVECPTVLFHVWLQPYKPPINPEEFSQNAP